MEYNRLTLVANWVTILYDGWRPGLNGPLHMFLSVHVLAVCTKLSDELVSTLVKETATVPFHRSRDYDSSLHYTVY